MTTIIEPPPAKSLPKGWGAPGFFRHVDAETYHALDAASKSRLWKMSSRNKVFGKPTGCPARLRWELDHGQEESEALMIGDAAHAALMEPARFKAMYITAGMCVGYYKNGSKCESSGTHRQGGDWYCGRHSSEGGVLDDDLGGMAILSADQLEMLRGQYESVRNHPTALALLNAPGFTEASFVWHDAPTNTLCKCRVDRYVNFNGEPVVVDVKTCKDASADGFMKDAAKLGYHVQAATYCEGVNAALRADAEARGVAMPPFVNRFIFIAIEKTPPYVVNVHEAIPNFINQGATEFRRLLETYADCVRTGVWPAYGTAINSLALPSWWANGEESEV